MSGLVIQTLLPKSITSEWVFLKLKQISDFQFSNQYAGMNDRNFNHKVHIHYFFVFLIKMSAGLALFKSVGQKSKGISKIFYFFLMFVNARFSSIYNFILLY